MKPATIATAIALSLASIAAANAAPAVASATSNLFGGPGVSYPVIGTMLQGSSLDAECDSSGWCQIQGTGRTNNISGWVTADTLRFVGGGSQPAPPQPNPRPVPPQPGNNSGPGFSFDFNFGNPPPRPLPQPLPPVHEDAGACFYAERNFRGPSFCVDESDSISRLPRNWNDRIRSVEVFGRVEVELCSDAGFYGSCVTLRSDAARLPSGIDRRVTAIDVY